VPKSLQKIAPEVYSEYLRKLKLRSIRLTKLNAELFFLPQSDSKLSFTVEFKAGELLHDDNIRFTADFAIEVMCEETKVARISASYEVINGADELPPKGFIDVFGPMNLSRLVYPFFREVVAGTTAKMELPTLFVPLNIFGPSGTKNFAKKPTTAGTK